MKNLKRVLVSMVAFVSICFSQAFAYSTTVFDSLDEVTADAELFFLIIVALAVLVTGFFVGRAWLSKMRQG